ncbi:MAG: acylphosphatase [Candidatus Riflebacteria bacterium]|nr:acylphosphatase [Candidatus Riflebacteria bacterium]
MIRRVEVIIHGEVQGVGFRVFAQRQAELLGINGWVRNRYDGSVETLIEGASAKVEQMLDLLHTGPRHAIVDSIETVTDETSENPLYAGFSVRF